MEGTKLFQKNKEAVLFLKHAYDNVYYITGEYQGNFDIQDGKVFSRDNHVDRSSHANGVGLSEFKNKIVDLVNK